MYQIIIISQPENKRYCHSSSENDFLDVPITGEAQSPFHNTLLYIIYMYV